MKHLTPDELVDAVEGTLAPDRQSHVDQCAACRDDAAALAVTLREAREVEIPEPSPLFWESFSSRVRHAIAEDAAPATGWAPAWLRWNVLVPLGALALVILALTVAMPRTPAPVPLVAVDESTPAASDVALVGEPEWAALSEIVGPVAVEHAHEAGIIVAPGDVERAAMHLTAAEQQELVRLLKEEMGGTLQ